MALKIVTGGTTGAADGTLVSSGNPLVITALNTAINAHIRCDDGFWSNDQSFDVPAELEVSFDAGATWYDNADEPITAPEIYAVNVPIKIRQTTAAASTSGSFVTNGTYTAIAALSTPTLTATVNGTSQIDLSWTNVANEDASPGYTIERSLDGSSWSALTTKAANVTTHSDTGLTAETRYYYRVKAEGSGRYSDSGWGTDDDTTASPWTLVAADTFTDSDSIDLASHTPTGTGAAGTWSAWYTSGSSLKITNNRVRVAGGAGAVTAEYHHSQSVTNGKLEADFVVNAANGYALMGFRHVGTSTSDGAWDAYRVSLDGATGIVQLNSVKAGSLGTYTIPSFTNTTYAIKLEIVGTSLKVYVNGVERISATNSSISAGGVVLIQQNSPSGTSTTNAVHVDNLKIYTHA